MSGSLISYIKHWMELLRHCWIKIMQVSLKSRTSRPLVGARNLFNQDHLLTSLLPAEARLFVLIEQIAHTEHWYTISILILVVGQNVIFGRDLIWWMRNFSSLVNQKSLGTFSFHSKMLRFLWNFLKGDDQPCAEFLSLWLLPIQVSAQQARAQRYNH